jgi:hypothetical protein
MDWTKALETFAGAGVGALFGFISLWMLWDERRRDIKALFDSQRDMNTTLSAVNTVLLAFVARFSPHDECTREVKQGMAIMAETQKIILEEVRENGRDIQKKVGG